MLKEMEIRKVNFNGDELMAIKKEGKIYVGIKWVCNSLGLQRRKQIEKIKHHVILSKGSDLSGVPSNGGVQQTQVLEIDYLPLWLATINPMRVKPEQKEKLVQYQLKAKDVLANAFLHGNTQTNNEYIIPQNYPDALRLAANLQEKVEELQPKADAFDNLMDADGWVNFNQAAKALNTGRTRLFRSLRNIEVLNKDNSPKQQYVEQGFLKAKPREIMGHIYIQPFVSAKGLYFLWRRLRCVA